MRGTFANIRIKNLMLPGVEGGFSIHYPDGDKMPIFDASMKYKQEGVDLVVLAGKEYGTGSSRDWAAKGPLLLGVKAVIAESLNASTAPTWWVWVSCRSSSGTGRMRKVSGWMDRRDQHCQFG